MAYTYRVVADPGTVVVVDGEEVAVEGVVWTAELDEHSTRLFPPEFKGRPRAGEVRLYISNDGDEHDESDELVGVQRAPTEDEMKAFF